MSYLPNTQIEQYLGNINLFLIRESHTVREVKSIPVYGIQDNQCTRLENDIVKNNCVIRNI